MVAKKQSAADAIKALTAQRKGVKPAKGETDKSEKKRPAKGGKNYIPKGLGNGGVRPGSGRKPLEQDDKRKSNKQAWEEFGAEETLVTIKSLEKGTVTERRVKMSRLRVGQEALFKKVQIGDVAAITEFNNRVGGKARQPIVGDDEEAPVRVDLGLDRFLEKAYGDDEE